MTIKEGKLVRKRGNNPNSTSPMLAENTGIQIQIFKYSVRNRQLGILVFMSHNSWLLATLTETYESCCAGWHQID